MKPRSPSPPRDTSASMWAAWVSARHPRVPVMDPSLTAFKTQQTGAGRDGRCGEQGLMGSRTVPLTGARADRRGLRWGAGYAQRAPSAQLLHARTRPRHTGEAPTGSVRGPEGRPLRHFARTPVNGGYARPPAFPAQLLRSQAGRFQGTGSSRSSHDSARRTPGTRVSPRPQHCGLRTNTSRTPQSPAQRIPQ